MNRRYRALIGPGLPVLVGAAILLGLLLHHTRGPEPGPITLAVAFGAGGALWARARYPVLTLVASGLLAAAVMHLDRPGGTLAVLAPAVALYSLALTRGRRVQTIATAAVVAAVLIAELSHAHRASPLQTLGDVLLVAIPLLAAAQVRAHRSNVQLLTERLELAERAREQEAERRAEQERMRIARDLHDVVAHTLTTINVQAATAGQLLDRNPSHARGALATIEHSSRAAISELRAILGVLRNGDHDDAPRTPAPGLDDIAELVRSARQDGLDVEFDVDGTPPEHVSEAVSLATYRIVQESLTNARRHAAGAPVKVELEFHEHEIALHVENGPGRSPNPGVSTPGVGIAGMRERAATVGGKLNATPTATGFRVDAALPYVLA